MVENSRGRPDRNGRTPKTPTRPRSASNVILTARRGHTSLSYGRPAPNAAEKTQARLAGFNYRRRLLEQLLLATNHNGVPGEGIEDVGPVKVMLESGIELDDVL